MAEKQSYEEELKAIAAGIIGVPTKKIEVLEDNSNGKLSLAAPSNARHRIEKATALEGISFTGTDDFNTNYSEILIPNSAEGVDRLQKALEASLTERITKDIKLTTQNMDAPQATIQRVLAAVAKEHGLEVTKSQRQIT